MIYLTPFNPETMQATGPSVDSGFASIDAAVAMLGPTFVRRSGRCATYPGGVFLSDFVVRVEP